MTGKTADRLVLKALDGEAVWPPPVWLMRQAGRYLPEYRKLRASAGNFIALCTTPAMATEATLQPIRRFGLDAAILFSDILIAPWALGQKLRYAEGEGPLMERLETLSDLDRLDLNRLKAGTEPVMEAVARVRAELPPETTLIGFAGSPFTVACYMLEGKGGNFARSLALTYSDPGLVASVIELMTTATIDYLSWQIEAGADCVMLFDSWAGLLPPDLFRAHVIHPTTRIVDALHLRHPGVKVIGFPRLAGLMALPYIAETGISGFGMDTATDAAALARLLPRSVALQGNLDPLLLRAGGVSLDHAVERIAGELAGLPHIFNLGHGILPDTPLEHVAQLIERLRSLPQRLLEDSREHATSRI
ncbi:uroporphyrinogen decarboxylase [Acidiphilium sp.]|uniref:uroporphyrinogen decarboxylase n=1 Tax=Acidiphilium sp. TaxID=527 RepID=UPI003D04372C